LESSKARSATLHLIFHELLVFLVVQAIEVLAEALGPQKSMVFGLIVTNRPIG
jgi:hypothetical protein